MKYEKIISKFKDRNPDILDISVHSSVLVPIINKENEPHLLFEIRSFDLNSQPGEICFPGGKIDQNETPLQSAIRETVEELNIPAEQMNIIGQLDLLVTPFNMIIYPFLAVIQNTCIENIYFNRKEVASIFTVPIKELLNQKPDCHKTKLKILLDRDFPYHLIQNGKNYNWKEGSYPIYFYRYQQYVIWGITAKILKNFLDILYDES